MQSIDAIKSERDNVSGGITFWEGRLESAPPSTLKERVILRILAQLDTRLNYCDRLLGR